MLENLTEACAIELKLGLNPKTGLVKVIKLISVKQLHWCSPALLHLVTWADGSEGAKTCGTIGAMCPEEIYVQHWTLLYMLCFTIVLPQIQLLMQFQMESDTNCMFSSQHFLRGWYLTVRYALGMSRQGVNVHSHRPSSWKFPCFFKKWWAIIQKSIYSLVSHNCWKHCNQLTICLIFIVELHVPSLQRKLT